MRPLYRRGLSADEVRKLFHVLDWMMQLPEDIEIDFRQQLEQYEQETRMPYVTSIERMAKKEGRQEGILAGKIQMLQRILLHEVESEESLLNQPIASLVQKLNDLQQQFDLRQ